MAQNDLVVVGIDVAKDKVGCLHSPVQIAADFPEQSPRAPQADCLASQVPSG
ncbi:MAG: hypothetical protein P4M05_31105 [Bradyrhizobium sp.]|nr:hypothetical protein [Bradyrhizobium sp.]